MLTSSTHMVPKSPISNERLQAGGFIYVDPYVESFLRKQGTTTEAASVDVFTPSAFASLTEVRREIEGAELAPASAAHLAELALNDPNLTNVAALEPIFHHDEYGPQILMVLLRGTGRALVLEPLPERWPAKIRVLVRARS